MTLHHYSVAGTLAACGQLADGVNHTTHAGDVIRFLGATPLAGAMADVCTACLAVANDQRPA